MALSKKRALEFLDFIKSSNRYLANDRFEDLESYKEAKSYIEGKFGKLFLMVTTKGHLCTECFEVSWSKGVWELVHCDDGGDAFSVTSGSLNELMSTLQSKYNVGRFEDYELTDFIASEITTHKVTKYLSVKTVGFDECATQGVLSDDIKCKVTCTSEADKMMAMKVLAINLYESRMSVQGTFQDSIDATIEELLVLK